MNPLVKLAANAVPNDKRYVLLAGAGLSIDANLPTAWGLMMAIAEFLRASVGEERGEQDTQTWFLESEYKDYKYDQLIGKFFPTSATQHDFMRDKLRADAPAQAHRQLAELARMGVLRCIITTNFDTLIEQALREVGLTVQVIATTEQLRTSGPLIQCKEFRVYKPHGTIEGGRLRNTPADLAKLLKPMERELTQVISDHGLIVLGYAGADETIRRIFRAKRQYLYPTFWVNPSVPTPDIPPLFGTGTFDHVPCKGASAFFNDLLGMYKRLDSFVPKPGLQTFARSAEDAIRANRSDCAALVKKFWGELSSELASMNPWDLANSPTKEVDYAGFTASLDRTTEVILVFVDIADAASEMNSEEGTLALFSGFDLIARHYYLPRGVGGHFDERWFDFWKFVGHELLATLVVTLMRTDRWELLAKLLREEFFVENPRSGESGMHNHEYLSGHVWFFSQEDRQKNYYGAYSHGHALNVRRRDGPLAERIPIRDFAEADYLLGLRSAFSGSFDDGKYGDRWTPHSIRFLMHTPLFLFKAQQRSFAERLLGVLAVPDIDTLRTKFDENRGFLYKATGDPTLYRSVQQFAAESFGSR